MLSVVHSPYVIKLNMEVVVDDAQHLVEIYIFIVRILLFNCYLEPLHCATVQIIYEIEIHICGIYLVVYI